MSVYVIAQLDIHDRARYQEYSRRFASTLEGHGGQLLAADESVAVIEGDWDYDKIVLLRFDDRAEFDRWSTSPAYTSIAADRRAATRGPVLLVNGLA